MLTNDSQGSLKLCRVRIVLVRVSWIQDVHELVHEVNSVIHRETTRALLVLAGHGISHGYILVELTLHKKILSNTKCLSIESDVILRDLSGFLEFLPSIVEILLHIVDVSLPLNEFCNCPKNHSDVFLVRIRHSGV